MSNLDHQIAVLRAIDAGDPVEYRLIPNGVTWRDNKGATANFVDLEYRIVPKPAEMWVNIYADNSVAVYFSENEARDRLDNRITRAAVHFREVSK